MDEISVHYLMLLTFRKSFGRCQIALWLVQPSFLQLSEWKKGSIKDLLLYHIVICQRLQSKDLELLDSITTLSGRKIRVSMKEVRATVNCFHEHVTQCMFCLSVLFCTFIVPLHTCNTKPLFPNQHEAFVMCKCESPQLQAMEYVCSILPVTSTVVSRPAARIFFGRGAKFLAWEWGA